MIFTKELDKALFLILKNDKKNRKEIIDFIQGIPKELRVDLKNEIKFLDKTHCELDLMLNPELSKEYKSKNGSSYIFKYNESINELLILKYGINNDRTILVLSDYNKYMGKFYSIKLKNKKIEKKEYTYGVSEEKDKKVFFRLNEDRNTSIPLIKEIKDEKKVKKLKMNDLKDLK